MTVDYGAESAEGKNPTLAKALARRAKAIADLEDDQPEVAQVADACLESAQKYLIAYVSQETKGSVLVLQLAQTIGTYLEDSFFLACDGRLDQSAALCRMASEATRVFCRLVDNPENEKLFRDRMTRDKEYRKVFRFKTDTPLEQALEKIYKICSEYGVHGHFLTTLHLEPYDYLHGGRFVELRVPANTRDSRILFWMRAYRIIWTLIVRGLAKDNACMSQSREMIEGFMLSLDELVATAERALRDEK